MRAPLLVPLLSGAALFAVSTYQTQIAEWQKSRAAGLKAEGGWLTVAGLFWLHEGANPLGRDASNEIVLPDGPARAGAFELHNGKVTATLDGSTRDLKPDSADVAKVGRLSLFVIKRGDKIGIRLKDPASEYVREFHGLEYFPIDESYRITARFVAEPRKISILNVLGQTDPEDSPGYAVFQLRGKELKLYPVIEDPKDPQLFFIFKDETAGKETYPAGRFLYSTMPENGKVELDFNKAYNPPCAFTPYATCPLPPPENRLPVRIEAGEKRYH
ncbi:MAG TPA: DUF1684 domain-containing protein [Bryobacteraceae bacterium]